MLDYTIEFLYKNQIRVEWVEAETAIQAIAQLQDKYNKKDPTFNGIPAPGFNYGNDVEIIACNLQSCTPALTKFFQSKKL